jgi:hypothetical protein
MAKLSLPKCTQEDRTLIVELESIPMGFGVNRSVGPYPLFPILLVPHSTLGPQRDVTCDGGPSIATTMIQGQPH